MVKKLRKHKKTKNHISKRKLTYGITAFFIILICSLSLYSSLQQSNDNDNTLPYKAAIVDHLSLSEPNQNFTQTATSILEKAGFTVDYYPGEEVTVNFYRNLPKHGYGLIVLRVHSALGAKRETVLALFTSEPYSKRKYVYEQLTRRIGIAGFSDLPPYFFGIEPDFIELSTNGRFQNTIIIMMGCDGLRYPVMAEAFIRKGAKAYISWDKGVLASHTDKATIHLLQHLTIEKQTIKKAVTETNKGVGQDPESGSILRYYPDSVDNYIIPNNASNLTMNAVQMNTAFYINKRKMDLSRIL